MLKKRGLESMLADITCSATPPSILSREMKMDVKSGKDSTNFHILK